jgi:ligand-binding sensor domain-containing protein
MKMRHGTAYLLIGSLITILFLGGCVQTLCDCAWGGTVYTWFDINGNGIHEDNEPPIAAVTVRTSGYGSDITNHIGEASFDLWMPGCPCGQELDLYFEADPPVGYKHTTSSRVSPGQSNQVEFGFDYDPTSATKTPNPISLRCDTYEGEAVLGDPHVTDIAIDSDGHVWVSTSGWGGVSEYDPEKDLWRNYSQFKYAQAIAVDNNGDIWVGGFEGVSILSAPSWESFGESCPSQVGDISEIHINHIAFDSQGSAWLGTPQGALVLDPETGECNLVTCPEWASGPSTEGVGPNNVDKIAFSADGSAWLLTFWHILSRVDPLNVDDNPSQCYTFSPYDGAGKELFSPLAPVTLPPYNESSSDQHLPFEPWVITSTNSNYLWIAGEGAIGRLEVDTGKLDYFELSHPETRYQYSELLVFSDESLLVGTRSLGLLRYWPPVGDGISHPPLIYDATYGLSHNNITSLFLSEDDSIWVGTTNGLSHCIFLDP